MFWINAPNILCLHTYIFEEHQRESLQQQSGSSAKSTHAAVDLQQFRNDEVGKGYQAKHVVRQKGVPNKASGIVDMSQRKEESMETTQTARSNAESITKESYLQCRGMRNFMREVEKILDNS